VAGPERELLQRRALTMANFQSFPKAGTAIIANGWPVRGRIPSGLAPV